MSRKYLGQPFDIHTGGIDHLPVHHENEIAQSAAAYGKPLARYWLHGEFLVLGRPGQERRMGKSERNPMTIRELAERGIEPLAFRYLCLTTHYRKKLYLTTAGLAAAAQGLRRLRQAAQGLPAPRKRGAARAEQRFLAAVNDDLNLPRALATVWDLLRSRRDAPAEQARTLVRFDAVLGLNLAQVPAAGQLAPLAVRRLVAEREAARRSRDWRRADELRQQVRELGYAIDDTTQGPRLKPT
jgi:cysteinyl-tRNA synthetase